MSTPPEPIVQPSAYLVSLLPEGHDDRSLFTVNVEYRGRGLWAVKSRSRSLSLDGEWSYGFAWSEGDREPATSEEMTSFDREQEAWLAAHRFDEATALRLAKDACRTLSYRGWTAEDAAAGRGYEDTPAAPGGAR
jgi:hypothetical protein